MIEEVLVTIGEVVIVMKEGGLLVVAVIVIAVPMTLRWMIILLFLASVRVTDGFKQIISSIILVHLKDMLNISK